MDLINAPGLYESNEGSSPSEDLDRLRTAPANTDTTPLFVQVVTPGIAPITNLLITNDTIDNGANIGTSVGTLVPEGGIGAYLYVITDDPDDKFLISGNDLVTKNPISYPDSSAHSVTIKVVDSNNEEFTKSFVITVIQVPAPPFTDNLHVKFNGVDQFCDTPYNAAFSGLATMSFSIWFKPEILTGTRCLISQFGANGKRSFRISQSGDRIFIGLSQDGINQTNFFSSSFIVLSQYVHLAVAFDGLNKTIKAWADGAIIIDSIHTYDNLKDTTNEPLRIGARGDTSFPEVEFFNGFINEVSIYDYVLTQLRVDELYNFGVTANVLNMSTSQFLISWWRMGDNDTFPTLTDNVNSNDLTMKNMLASNIENISYSNSFSMNFNGVDENIITPIDFSGFTQLTISYWVLRSGTDRTNVSQSNNGNTVRLKTLRNTNGLTYFVMNSIFSSYTDNAIGWLLLTFTYDGSLPNADRVKCYYGDTPQVPTTYGAFPSVVPTIPETFNIGKDNGISSFSKGNFDEVSFWDKALSQAEITEIYNGGIPDDLLIHSANANLLAWYRMGENLAGSTMPDSSQNTNDATLVNMDDTNKDVSTP